MKYVFNTTFYPSPCHRCIVAVRTLTNTTSVAAEDLGFDDTVYRFLFPEQIPLVKIVAARYWSILFMGLVSTLDLVCAQLRRARSVEHVQPAATELEEQLLVLLHGVFNFRDEVAVFDPETVSTVEQGRPSHCAHASGCVVKCHATFLF